MSYFRQYRPARHTLFPAGVKNLIIINVIMFAAKMFAETRGMDLDRMLGLYHPLSSEFHWYQYITSMFMHADIPHIFSNMLGLWMFGYILENAYGLKRFLVFYLIAGVGASLIYQVWMSVNQVRAIHNLGFTGGNFELLQQFPPAGLMVGASGAVYGVLMGTALVFPNTELPYLNFMGISMKVKWIAMLYGGGELLRAWQQNPGDRVAHFAHLGGMIFGFILVKIYSRNRNSFY